MPVRPPSSRLQGGCGQVPPAGGGRRAGMARRWWRSRPVAAEDGKVTVGGDDRAPVDIGIPPAGLPAIVEAAAGRRGGPAGAARGAGRDGPPGAVAPPPAGLPAIVEAATSRLEGLTDARRRELERDLLFVRARLGVRAGARRREGSG